MKNRLKPNRYKDINYFSLLWLDRRVMLRCSAYPPLWIRYNFRSRLSIYNLYRRGKVKLYSRINIMYITNFSTIIICQVKE